MMKELGTSPEKMEKYYIYNVLSKGDRNDRNYPKTYNLVVGEKGLYLKRKENGKIEEIHFYPYSETRHLRLETDWIGIYLKD